MYLTKILFVSALLAIMLEANSQGNCLVYPEHSGERLACELSYRAIEYRQGSAPSQILFDAAIKIGPDYAYAYYEKSVPFFKRGMFVEATKLLNKAIEIDPMTYLSYRAYWYFSNRSFDACIADLERYYFELGGRIESTPGGELEMRMLLAMSYAQSGDLDRAIELAQYGVNNYETLGYWIGPYDYHVLGVLYYKNNQFEKSKAAFAEQLKMNDRFADTYYYLALTHKSLGNDQVANELFHDALNRFEGKMNGYSIGMFGDYNVRKQEVLAEIE